MDRPLDVVVLPARERPQRVATRLRERGLGAEAVADDEVHERIERSRPDLVACLDGADRSPLESLAAVREADATVPAVLVATDEERAAGLAAVAGDATTVATADATEEEPVPADTPEDGPAPADGTAGEADSVDAPESGPDMVDAVAAAVERSVPAARSGPEGTGVPRASDGELRTEHDRYLTMLDQLPDPVVIASLESSPVIRYVNATFEEDFGYDADVARGRTVEELLVPDDKDAGLVGLSDVAEGAVVERIVRRRTVDGVREFLFRGFRTTIGGRPEAFVVYTDVTRRQRRARRLNALHGSARELLAAEDVTDVAAVAVDAAAEILDLPATGIHLANGADRLEPVACSAAARELFDGRPPTYTPADEVVWSVYETGEPRVIDDVEDADDVDRDSPAESAMILPLGGHGVFISSAPRHREFGDETVDLARLLAANTEAALTRARNVGAVRERERELRALFENVPIPAVSVDHRDGRAIVLEVNPAFEETFGYDAAELVGEDIDDYVTPEDRNEEAAAIAARASAGEILSREVRRQTADGLRDFLLTTAPVEPGAQDGLAYGFYVDITEREQRQQRLRVLSRVLRHDIRNQVTLIKGSAELVADRVTDPAVERTADDIARAAQELADIGRKTRIVERTQVGVDPGEVDRVGRVVERAVAPVRESFPDARVTVDVPEVDAVGSAEAVALALRELVENAVVHNDADEPRVRIRGGTTDEGFLELAVTDDGPGIPDEELAVLTGECEPTQLEHGSGLGLWIAKWIVGGVGGEFGIRERDGGGTVVELSVPLASARRGRDGTFD